MTNFDRKSSICSSDRSGRWAMSTLTLPFRAARYMTTRWMLRRSGALRARPRSAVPGMPLLRVELDDQLFLHGRVDDLPRGQRVDEHPHAVRDDLQPRRHLPLAGLGAGDDERRQLEGLLLDLDDVAGRATERRDVDLAAVDGEVTVPHQLACHVAALG